MNEYERYFGQKQYTALQLSTMVNSELERIYKVLIRSPWNVQIARNFRDIRIKSILREQIVLFKQIIDMRKAENTVKADADVSYMGVTDSHVENFSGKLSYKDGKLRIEMFAKYGGETSYSDYQYGLSKEIPIDREELISKILKHGGNYLKRLIQRNIQNDIYDEDQECMTCLEDWFHDANLTVDAANPRRTYEIDFAQNPKYVEDAESLDKVAFDGGIRVFMDALEYNIGSNSGTFKAHTFMKHYVPDYR